MEGITYPNRAYLRDMTGDDPQGWLSCPLMQFEGDAEGSLTYELSPYAEFIDTRPPTGDFEISGTTNLLGDTHTCAEDFLEYQVSNHTTIRLMSSGGLIEQAWLTEPRARFPKQTTPQIWPSARPSLTPILPSTKGPSTLCQQLTPPLMLCWPTAT